MPGGIEFLKVSGAGNDFVVVDNRDGRIPEPEKPALAARLCPRRTAVGADGLVLVERSDGCDLRMRIFNADGSEAEMCGNAARCVARYAVARGMAAPRFTLETAAGPVPAEVVDDRARVRLPDTDAPAHLPAFAFAEREADVYAVDTGVPHAVVPVADVEAVDVLALGRALRRHPAFAPAGTNADFIDRADGLVRVRTYERGVEDETLACGTGVTASALVAAVAWGAPGPVTLRTRGGDRLTVAFRLDGARALDIWLDGPAEPIYAGRTPTDWL